jgi:alkylation response protein AidB-like acyl-CoA dehydrogenase
MAANAILLGGTEEQKQDLLPGIAEGESVLTMALFETPHGKSSTDIGMKVEAAADGWRLNGTKTNVLDAQVADVLLVAGQTASGVSLFVVPSDAAGVSIEPVSTLDTTRRQATVTLDGVDVGSGSLLGAEGEAGSVIDAVLGLTSIALALEQVGGAQWCLATAVEHAGTRFQFGRAIGSFQSIKHRCADMLVAVEHAKSTAYHAARVVEDAEELALAAPLAKSTCSSAFLQAAGDAIQILGGTGFTWEHDVHLYFKRAKSTSLMFGDIRHQRRLLADALGL